MNLQLFEIEGLALLKPKIFHDDRGFFFESFNEDNFNKTIGKEIKFVQDNHSFSTKKVLRGIHFQLPPFAQGKLVRVIDGEVLDVAVDLRRNSETFGKWVSVILNSSENHQFWIPEGFGHGFVVISETAHFLYKTTNYYNKNSEGSIIWNDSTLNINWGIRDPIINNKDLSAKPFLESEYF
ncbi:MAG: dTDP-4-dehydrorhamnose 3,5-epimerase [Gammaproteobacteria bacterium]|tara:strand:+ start:4172 stop:4714 length:543 start_codon:yes stop_codon:yes gene_type:complete